MPSIEIFKELNNQGYILNDRFSKYDTLAGKTDLEYLFNTLQSIKDSKGNPAVITAVTNVANPDFEKIKADDYNGYHFEPFTKTLEKYNRHKDTFSIWKQGMNIGIFVPEFHGREHITVQLWMDRLKSGDKLVRNAFNHNYASVNTPSVNVNASQFRPEFFFENDIHIKFLKEAIVSGVDLFKDIFDYTPRALVPSNGIFHPTFEKTLSDTGVKHLYISHLMSVPNGKGALKKKYYRNGKKTQSGLTYYTRNCAFEPTSNNYNGIEHTLKQINAAFHWRKPANISTHRVNFVGGIDPANRAKGLIELKKLLEAIVINWPDVEFMSSAKMLNQVYNNKRNHDK